MRISSIHITNFLGARAVHLDITTPVALLCGANGAGKSSVRDGVALALTADLGRVALKKEAPELITDDAEAAIVSLTTADGDDYSVAIKRNGKISDSQAGRKADPAMVYALDGQRFARLEPNDRRTFLMGLMQVKTDGAAVRARMIAKGCDAEKVERIAPMLRAGFDAAHKDAAAKASETRALWKATTGENYGSEKAKTWQAGVPAWNAEHLPKLQTELKHADAALEQWQREIGRLDAVRKQRAQLQAKLPALQEHAARVERIRTKLATDEATLADVEQRLKVAQAAAGAGPRVGLVHELATQLALMLDHGDRVGWFDNRGDRVVRDDAAAALAIYDREHGKVGATTGDPEAAARLPALRNAHVTATSAVANDRRDLEAAIGAGAEVASIEAQLKEPFDSAALAEAEAQAEKIRVQRAEVQRQADTQAAIKREVEQADKRTADALRHHIDVQQWEAIADALAPNGIPGEILGEALGPINDRLRQSAADTGWPVVQIGADMGITAGGRSVRLLSESERWRVDAVLAEAIAHLSGTGILVLDRGDVLDLPGRGELLGWLDMLADTGEIHTALVFMTLKAAPAGLPPTIQAHWIAGGVLGAEANQEAACLSAA